MQSSISANAINPEDEPSMKTLIINLTLVSIMLGLTVYASVLG